jgi:hypothetical protein
VPPDWWYSQINQDAVNLTNQNTLALIQNVAQLEWLDKSYAGGVDDLILLVGSNAPASLLERRGVRFWDETALVDAATAEKHLLLAPVLASQFFEQCQMLARDDDLGALPDFAGELRLPIEICLNAAYAYRRIMAEQDVQTVLIFDAPDVGMIRNGPAPAFVPALSLSRAVLRFCAEEVNAQVEAVANPWSPPAGNRPWRARVSLDDRLPPAVGKRVQPARAPWAVIWRDGMWPSEIAISDAQLRTAFDWNVLQLSSADLELFAEAVRPWINATSSEVILELMQRAKLGRAPQSTHPEVFANRYLEFQFHAVAVEVLRAQTQRKVFEAILSSLNSKVVVLQADTFGVERGLEQTAADLSVPTVGLLHGGLGPLSGFVGLVGEPSVTAIWSSEDRTNLEACCQRGKKLVEIGSLKFDSRYRQAIDPATIPAPSVCEERDQLDRIISRENKREVVILLLTSPTRVGLSFPTVDEDRYRQAWDEIIRIASVRTDWKFVIRAHPAFDDLEYYRSIVSRSSNNIVISSELDLGGALRSSDLAILMNYCSTAAVEAMFERVPVLFLSSALRKSRYTGDPLRRNGIYEAASTSAVESLIEAAIEDSPTRERLVSRGIELLATIVGDNGIPAPVRFRRVIESVGNAYPARGTRSLDSRSQNDSGDITSPSGASSAAIGYEQLRNAIGPGGELGRDGAVAMAAVIASLPVEPLGTLSLFRKLRQDLRKTGITERVQRQLLLAGALLTMRKRLEEKQWRDAAAFSLFAMGVCAFSAVTSAEFWSLSVKAAAMSTRATHRAGNWVDSWTYGLRARLRQRMGE